MTAMSPLCTESQLFLARVLFILASVHFYSKKMQLKLLFTVLIEYLPIILR